MRVHGCLNPPSGPRGAFPLQGARVSRSNSAQA
ncbi:hypothetical protein STVIR_5260 [Streptomyces viridochromogenes Tue57]|uniref:Uncharacterized protein n=1 Tax=Streptomyces viridochromogenes Tue57 TaxID=1160705 RepID=L8PCF7_STRVR|nr:hypothetical protein STVIR_5260 [Streptomyces viridochromogenes Tue57]